MTPPFIAATRARYMSFASVWMTLPITTWPTSSPLHVGAGERFADHLGAEIGRRNVFQAAAEIPDRGSYAGDDDDFTLHRPLPSLDRIVRPPYSRIGGAA